MNREVSHESIINLEKPILTTVEENILIQAISKGDDFAFSELYSRYRRQIYNYILRMLNDANGAEDVMQEVFLAIWKGSTKFQHKSTLKTWIYRIAYHKAISWLRKHSYKNSTIEINENMSDVSDLEKEAISSGQSIDLRHAINQLSIKHRSVLELAFVQDMSYSEIAEVLDCPIGTVKSRMTYALRTMTQVLSNLKVDKINEIGEEL